MAHRIGRWIASLCLAPMLLSCAYYGDAHVAVYGPYRVSHDAELVELVAERLRAGGYTVMEADPVTGRVVVPARFVNRRGRRASFVFQCFQHGWVQLRIEGSLVHRRRFDYDTVPNGLRNEYVRLAAAFDLPGRHR